MVDPLTKCFSGITGAGIPAVRTQVPFRERGRAGKREGLLSFSHGSSGAVSGYLTVFPGPGIFPTVEDGENVHLRSYCPCPQINRGIIWKGAVHALKDSAVAGKFRTFSWPRGTLKVKKAASGETAFFLKVVAL